MTALVRITFTPGPAARRIAGAWWPASRNLSAEVPRLLPLLGRVGQHARELVVHRADWADHPDQVTASGRTISIDWGGEPAHLLRAADEYGRSLTLFVVPADTESLTAHRALSLATDHRQPVGLGDILRVAATDSWATAGEPVTG
ncbi:hypothetical protein Athai_67850 [Actinocatenispora thailandica]|uniref:Uncharacterized protein n=1 Tax=Actinocatenispora thailandica TaxID=227318 RepID=A0A7R7DWQ0_9ACTN|nr:DUF5994 family protein [Actinocatenispora thailandica]BCJ39282.1 hypothetical protein Athai_67850 [Actinocatenispora thailandica]